MIRKINRHICLNKFPNFPLRQFDKITEEELYFYPEVISSYILTYTSKTKEDYLYNLGYVIIEMMNHLKVEKLFFLGDIEIPWRYRKSENKSDIAGLQFFIDNKVGKKFNGALLVETTEIHEFIVHLAQLTRTNTILSYVYFSDNKQNLIGHICQYGNIHLSTLNSDTDELIQRFINKSKFKIVIGGNCKSKF